MNKVIVGLILILTLLPLETFSAGKKSHTLTLTITIPPILDNINTEQQTPDKNLITTTKMAVRNGETVLLKTTTAK